MPRSRRSAKNAGAAFERLVADYLRDHLDDRIDRRVKTGAQDKGDIANVRDAFNRRVVIECKDYSGRLQPGPWITEAHTERDNDQAHAGVVVAKRRGTTNPAEQYVLMTLEDLVTILRGENQ